MELRGQAHDHGMPKPEVARITLELEADADPIRGSVEHPDGDRKAFWGWLELMETLRGVAARDIEAKGIRSRQRTTAQEEP